MTYNINIIMLKQQSIRPMCKECNKLPSRPNGRSISGYQRWHTLCNYCAKLKYTKKKKDSKCSICNFESIDSCQLCLINGETICQNCNALRLKNIKKRAELTVDATINWEDIRL